MDRRHPLYTQYRAQRRALGLTNQDIAEVADVALATVARELGIEPQAPMSLAMAQRLGAALGFDASYVALVHARDSVSAQSRSPRLRETARSLLRDVRGDLDDNILAHHPFHAPLPGRRLGFRAERCRRGVSLQRIARALHDGPERLSRSELRAFERGVAELPEHAIERALAALCALSPDAASLSIQDLDGLGAELCIAHAVSDTLIWKSYKDSTPIGQRFQCPYEPGYDLRVATSPTAWRAMDVRLIHATQPRSVTRSRVRVMGLGPRGVQIGVVIHGAVELALGTAPFTPADGGDALELDSPAVQQRRVHRTGDIVLCQGGQYYRMAFLSRSTLVALIQIRSDLRAG